MGESLVAQLHELWDREPAPGWTGGRDDLIIRAVVRTKEEATRLKIDLGGLVVRDNKATPLLDTSRRQGGTQT